MKAELKEKWLEALRSGKFKQGKGALRNSADEYCCLGVFCSVAGLPFIGPGEELSSTGDPMEVYYVGIWTGEWALPTRGMRNSFRIFGSDSLKEDPLDLVLRLATLNDCGKDEGVGDLIPQNFAQIADYIEKNLVVD